MPNQEIRELIRKNRLKHYEVAKKLNIAAVTFSVWLRTELDQDKKDRIRKAIDELKHELNV